MGTLRSGRSARMLIAVLAAVSAGACSGGGPGSGAGSPGGDASPNPRPAGGRLAWSQAGPAASVVNAYRYTLYIDNAPTVLTGVSCAEARNAAGFECAAPLPALPAGARSLQLSAFDPVTGLESARSGPLMLGLTGTADGTVRLREAADVPRTVCPPDRPDPCFRVSALASLPETVRRIRVLPDGRLLLLFEGGDLVVYPSGAIETPPLPRAASGAAAVAADVSLDPDFPSNRFVYLAVVTTLPAGERTASVVRLREVGGTLGEPAGIVTDLPLAPIGRPAVSMGPDRHLYLAMPSAPAATRSTRPYDGLLLRFTEEGRAAGDERSASPALASGASLPTALAWSDRATLLMAAGDGQTPSISALAADGPAVWSAGRRDPEPRRVIDLAVRPDGSSMVAGADPDVVYVAAPAGHGARGPGRFQPLVLPAFTPTAIAAVGTSMLVAVSRPAPAPALLLRWELAAADSARR